MFSLRTKTKAYYFCSLCRGRLNVLRDDGDIFHARCPEYRRGGALPHDVILTCETPDALRKYAPILFRPIPEPERRWYPFKP
jgi:hypothetical protein